MTFSTLREMACHPAAYPEGSSVEQRHGLITIAALHLLFSQHLCSWIKLPVSDPALILCAKPQRVDLPIAFSLKIIVSFDRSLQYTPALFQWGVTAFPSLSVTSVSSEIEFSRSTRRSLRSLLPPKARTTSQRIAQSVATGEGFKRRLRIGS